MLAMIPGLLLCVGLHLPLSVEPPPGHPVELRVAPVVELWLTVRTLSEQEGLPEDAQLATAVTAMRALGEALGTASGFGLVEGNLVDVADGAALVRAFGELPETWRSRGGEELRLRAPCVAAASAVAALEPRWREEQWPERETLLLSWRERLARAFDEHGPAIYARLRETLGLSAEQGSIPVYLVTSAPWPGAFTHRRRGGGGVCFVAIEEPLPDLVEAVVHETVHALDLSTPGPGSLLVELRQALGDAGVPPRAVHDWAHTLFFLEAGACVRAVVDPEHVDYGDRTTLYARSRPQVDVERPLWAAYVAGEMERPALIAAIVEAADAVRVPTDAMSPPR